MSVPALVARGPAHNRAQRDQDPRSRLQTTYAWPSALKSFGLRTPRGAPRAGFLSHLSRRSKRNFYGPRDAHASHGPLFKSHDHTGCSIPRVLFQGSCRPDCTLSRHSMVHEHTLHEGKREEQPQCSPFNPQTTETGDRQVTQSLATPAGSFPPA